MIAGKSKYSPETLSIVRDMVKSGAHAWSISKKTGIPRSSIYYYIKKARATIKCGDSRKLHRMAIGFRE